MSKESFQHALEQLPEGGKDVMATLAEQWIKEGELRGEKRGEKRGELKNSQEMLILAIQNKFGMTGTSLSNKITSIMSVDTLKELFNQIFLVDDKQSFSKMIDQVTRKVDS